MTDHDEMNDVFPAETGNDGENTKEKMPVRARIARCTVLFRYLLPPVTGIALAILSAFYSVRVLQYGKLIRISPIRLCYHTLKNARASIGSQNASFASGFYGALTAGIIIFALLFLFALFCSIFAAVTALRAFRAGEKSETAKRMKILFRILFPNRICYFLSHALFCISALFPTYFSFISKRFVQVSTSSVIYIRFDLPLTVVLFLTALSLVAAFASHRFEDEAHMNMFRVYHGE